MNFDNYNNYKLCFVSDTSAYFTTKDVTTQWGDDWNDAPYEHNAGEPYYWRRESNEKEYSIVMLHFNADLIAPCDGIFNSPYTVQNINKGVVPWLQSYDGKNKIYAGLNIPSFVSNIKNLKGEVYFPLSLL